MVLSAQFDFTMQLFTGLTFKEKLCENVMHFGQKHISLILVFFVLSLVGCAPRYNTFKFDLQYSRGISGNVVGSERSDTSRIYLERPDVSKLKREPDGSTLLRELTIPDISPIIYKFVTPSNVDDWLGYALSSELENIGYEVVLVERLPVHRDVLGVRVYVTETFAGIDSNFRYVLPGARIGFSLTLSRAGQLIAEYEVIGDGVVQLSKYGSASQTTPSLSTAMDKALQNAIKKLLPQLQADLNRYGI